MVSGGEHLFGIWQPGLVRDRQSRPRVPVHESPSAITSLVTGTAARHVVNCWCWTIAAVDVHMTASFVIVPLSALRLFRRSTVDHVMRGAVPQLLCLPANSLRGPPA